MTMTTLLTWTHRKQRVRNQIRSVLAVVLAAVLATSCVAHRQIPVVLPTTPPDADDIRAQVSVGDFVRVVLADGRRMNFVVKSANANSLIGEGGQYVSYSDIARLEREGIDGKATAVLVLAPIVVFFLLLSFGVIGLVPAFVSGGA